jgi:hypothetical protein
VRSSPFATNRGRLVRRVLIGMSGLALVLFIVSHASEGPATDPRSRSRGSGVVDGDRAPRVAPPIADPYAAAVQPLETDARELRKTLEPRQQVRFDAVVETATTFAVEYATYSAQESPQSHVARLPSPSESLRNDLLAQFSQRWPEISANRTVAAARRGSAPVRVAAFSLSKAQLEVQLIQEVSTTAERQTHNHTYRVVLQWVPASAGDGPGSMPPVASLGASASPGIAAGSNASAKQIEGTWFVTGIADK